MRPYSICFLVIALQMVLPCTYLGTTLADPAMTTIRVMHTPTHTRIIVPADFIFKPDTIETIDTYKNPLRQIGEVLLHSPQTHVLVTAYTNGNQDSSFKNQLTHNQAEIVANYLWTQGTAAKRLSVATGGAKPIVPNTPQRRALNRRIEITLS